MATLHGRGRWFFNLLYCSFEFSAVVIVRVTAIKRTSYRLLLQERTCARIHAGVSGQWSSHGGQQRRKAGGHRGLRRGSFSRRRRLGRLRSCQ